MNVDGLLGPGIDDRPDLGRRHAGQRQVVPRMVAHHPAQARLALHPEQRVIVGLIMGSVGQQRHEIVVEYERAVIGRVGDAAHPLVAGAQVAFRIVMGRHVADIIFDLSLPGTFGPVRRNQHPLACQGVEAAMGVIVEIEHDGNSL
jgi:hypothetical protein